MHPNILLEYMPRALGLGLCYTGNRFSRIITSVLKKVVVETKRSEIKTQNKATGQEQRQPEMKTC